MKNATDLLSQVECYSFRYNAPLDIKIKMINCFVFISNAIDTETEKKRKKRNRKKREERYKNLLYTPEPSEYLHVYV